MSHWIQDAEAALAGQKSPDVDTVPVVKPPLIDADATRALIAPFLAAFFGAAAYFQEQRTGQPFDPIAMGLRVLAMAMLVRTFVLGFGFWRRLKLSMASAGYGLVLTDEGLLLRRPDGDVVVPKADVLAVKERGEWSGRSGGRWNDVYVITRPSSGRAYLSLPPIFDRSTGVLAERLMRWRGVVKAPEDYEPPAPSELPSKLFDQAASGDAAPDITVIRHGSAWLRRAPYATMLLGLAILDGFLRLPEAKRAAVGALVPGIIVFALLIVPVLWAIMIRYDIKPRKGVSLVLTPAEMLMRTREGVHVVRWQKLEQLRVESKRSWSLLHGQHEVRSLAIHRSDGDSISYLESFLGAPVEVVIALCDALRKGQLSPATTAGASGPEPESESEQASG